MINTPFSTRAFSGPRLRVELLFIVAKEAFLVVPPGRVRQTWLVELVAPDEFPFGCVDGRRQQNQKQGSESVSACVAPGSLREVGGSCAGSIMVRDVVHDTSWGGCACELSAPGCRWILAPFSRRFPLTRPAKRPGGRRCDALKCGRLLPLSSPSKAEASFRTPHRPLPED